jgi:hypothetical protein
VLFFGDSAISKKKTKSPHGKCRLKIPNEIDLINSIINKCQHLHCRAKKLVLLNDLIPMTSRRSYPVVSRDCDLCESYG